MSVAAGTAEGGESRSARELMREEAASANKYMNRFPWEMVAWGLGNFVLWLAIWPLTLRSCARAANSSTSPSR
jgi:hypothetical protein